MCQIGRPYGNTYAHRARAVGAGGRAARVARARVQQLSQHARDLGLRAGDPLHHIAPVTLARTCHPSRHIAHTHAPRTGIPGHKHTHTCPTTHTRDPSHRSPPHTRTASRKRRFIFSRSSSSRTRRGLRQQRRYTWDTHMSNGRSIREMHCGIARVPPLRGTRRRRRRCAFENPYRYARIRICIWPHALIDTDMRAHSDMHMAAHANAYRHARAFGYAYLRIAASSAGIASLRESM